MTELQDIFLGDLASGLKGDSAKRVGEKLNAWFAALRSGMAAVRLNDDAADLSFSIRHDGAGDLGLFVGEAGAAEENQILAVGIDKTTGAITTNALTAFGQVKVKTPDGITLLVSGATKGVRVVTDATQSAIEGVDQSGSESHQPIVVMGSSARLTTPGNSGLIVDSVGRVGIGIAAPGAELEVAAQGGDNDVRIQLRPSDDHSAQVGCSTGLFFMDAGVGKPIGFYADGALRGVIATNGNVALGPNSPSTALDINRSTAADVYTRIRNSVASSGFDIGVSSSGACYVFNRNASSLVLGANNADKLVIASGGTVRPGTSGQNFGESGTPWNNSFFAVSPTITSDARLKSSVRTLTEAERAAARALHAEIGIYQFLASIAEKGEAGARLHVGMTVQRAIEIMEAHGLDPWRYGFICRDEITRRVKVMQTRIVPATEVVEEVYTEIEIRAGTPVQVRKTRMATRPVVEMTAVVDENGQPVLRGDDPLMHPVPVMVEREVEIEIEEPAGDILGFREGQLAMFMLAGLANV